jgi:hypothetical protein
MVFAGQALLENMLPKHIARRLVRDTTLQHHAVASAELGPSAEMTKQVEQGASVLVLDPSSSWSRDGPNTIAYKQWHPAVSVLFAVRA